MHRLVGAGNAWLRGEFAEFDEGAPAPMDDEPEAEEERLAVAKAIESLERNGGFRWRKRWPTSDSP